MAFSDGIKTGNVTLTGITPPGISVRGTAGLAASYVAEKGPLPKSGDLSIILNWAGEPRCIIETVNVRLWPFGEVPAWFAEIEGEGDGSLEYWKRVHREYFTRESEEIGIVFDDASTIVCEEFRVIYRGG